MLWVLLASLPVGVLIGIVGIGGLLLPALLGQVTGDPHLAAGTSLFAFLFTGLVAAVDLVRSGRLERRSALPLAAGAAPGALVGSLVAGLVPGPVLVGLLAAVCLVSGVHNLLSTPSGGRRRLPTLAMVVVALVVGALSAMTGTGGPVLLVPVLLALGVETRSTIALALFSQVPIVALAVVGYASARQIDYAWGSAFGVVAALGVLLGTGLGSRAHPAALRRVAAVALVLTGVYLGSTVLV